jgi:hypothetical protein
MHIPLRPETMEEIRRSERKAMFWAVVTVLALMGVVYFCEKLVAQHAAATSQVTRIRQIPIPPDSALQDCQMYVVQYPGSWAFGNVEQHIVIRCPTGVAITK